MESNQPILLELIDDIPYAMPIYQRDEGVRIL